MTIILVDGVGHWVERWVDRLPPYYNVVRPAPPTLVSAVMHEIFGLAGLPRPTEIVVFKYASEIDYMGRYVYRLAGAPAVPIRYGRNEPEDDVDRALDTMIQAEEYKIIKEVDDDWRGLFGAAD